ncbi:exo-alpha-sialidase [Microbacterium lacus]|uniref:exo-alpha-sialidase n=1 Tax=Microbacterium lacus TaxID=415217 RepID=UPI00384CBE92
MALTVAVPAHAAPTPDSVTTPNAAPGSFASSNIGGDRTSANFFYRIPALAHLGDGVVVASWDARPGSAADAPNPNSIIQRRSVDNGQTWGPLQIIAAGHTADGSGPRYGYSDPSYVVDRETGRVFNFFVYSKDQGFQGSRYGNDDADRQIISSAVIHSDDGGVTWTTPRLITEVTKPANGTVANGVYTPVAGDVRGNFATSGEGIQLRYGEHAGRLLQQFAGTILQPDGSVQIQAYTVYSDDHGDTWHKGQNVGVGMDENKVVELSDGRVMLNSRDSSNGRLRKVAISEDGGVTYGPVERDSELPDPTNNASLIRLHPDAVEGSAEARKLLFTNSNNGANGDRVNGAARVSCDDGATWPGLRTIDSGFFAYSSATVLDDGRIGVLWERNYTSDMRLTSFDDAWLNYVCAPLSVPEQQAEPGGTIDVPVTITNQEQTEISGTVTFFTPAGWDASSAPVTTLAPGESTTVEVSLTSPTTAVGANRLQAAFTRTDGRISQFTTTVQLPQSTSIGLTLTSTNTTPARDLATNPFQAGDVLSYSLRVTSTASVATLVTPSAANFTSGFLPTACRWQNLAGQGAYNCTTPRRTLTADDIERGWFQPEFSFTVAPMSDTAKTVVVNHTGAPVALRDGVLGATITGQRADAGRDLETSPYSAGEQVPYSFRIDSTSPVAATIAPTEGTFAPLVPPGAGNCRWTNLAAFGGYDCTTPRHTVTAEEVADGYFTASSTWTISTSGLTAATLEVDGGEVDVAARSPRLSETLTGTWNDTNGNGVANVGDTITWVASVANTGNVRLTDVVANDAALGEVLAGESVTVFTKTVPMDAANLAAASPTVPSLEVSGSNGALAAVVDEAVTAPAIPFASPWDKTAVYTKGKMVTFAGQLWVATWWTKDQAPGDATGAWQQIVTTDAGIALWVPTRIFVKADVVIHEGAAYVAKWWTRNQQPDGTARSPWEELDGD